MAKLTTAEFIEAIKELSVMELNDLVKACEEEFGVPLRRWSRSRSPRLRLMISRLSWKSRARRLPLSNLHGLKNTDSGRAFFRSLFYVTIHSPVPIRPRAYSTWQLCCLVE